MQTIFNADMKLIALYLDATNQLFIDSEEMLTQEQADKLKLDYSQKTSTVIIEEYFFTDEEAEELGIEVDDILWEG